MAKRQREEESQMLDLEDIEVQKRNKPDNELPASNLDEEEEVSSQELSALLMTLQQELFDPLPNSEEDDLQHHSLDLTTAECSPNSATKDEEEEDEKEGVIRHLLEASDDELGIPNRVDTVNESFNGGDDLFNPFPVCDELWELEDEAANYYTLMQSELFM